MTDQEIGGTKLALTILRTLRPTSQFVRISKYVKKAGSSNRITDGVSDVTLCMGISYPKMIADAKKTVNALTDADLEKLASTLTGFVNARAKDSPKRTLTLADMKQAKDEVLKSLDTSSQPGGHYVAKDQEDPYEPLTREDGSAVTGIKVHKQTGEVQMWGVLVSEMVHQKPEYKSSKQGVEAAAKEALEKLTRKSKFRQYTLKAGNFDSVALEGIKLDDRHFQTVQTILSDN